MRIEHEKLKFDFSLFRLNFHRKLQLNLIRSHATGYGKPLTPSQTRMLLALRINVLAKGHSGISAENIKKMIAAFNGDLSFFLENLLQPFVCHMCHNKVLSVVREISVR